MAFLTDSWELCCLNGVAHWINLAVWNSCVCFHRYFSLICVHFIKGCSGGGEKVAVWRLMILSASGLSSSLCWEGFRAPRLHSWRGGSRLGWAGICLKKAEKQAIKVVIRRKIFNSRFEVQSRNHLIRNAVYENSVGWLCAWRRCQSSYRTGQLASSFTAALRWKSGWKIELHFFSACLMKKKVFPLCLSLSPSLNVHGWWIDEVIILWKGKDL